MPYSSCINYAYHVTLLLPPLYFTTKHFHLISRVEAFVLLSMEKFSKWNDPSTGINPFAPSKGSLRSAPKSLGAKLPRAIAGILLSLVRLPLLVIVAPLIVIADVIQIIVPLWPWRKLVRWLLLSPLCRLALFLLGYWNIVERVPDYRRLRLPAGNRSRRKVPKMHFGHGIASSSIILCNHTSFVEVLYLSARFGADFASSDLGSNALVRRCSVVATILASVSGPARAVSDSTKSAPTLAELAAMASSRSGAPLAILVEGTGVRSNGSAILKFSDAACAALENEAENLCIHLLGFKYDASQFSSSYTVGSSLAYTLRSCFQIANGMSAWHLAHSPRIGFLPSTKTLDDKERAHVASSEGLRGLLAAIVGPRGVKCVSLGAAEYVSFLEYWSASAAGKVKKQ